MQCTFQNFVGNFIQNFNNNNNNNNKLFASDSYIVHMDIKNIKHILYKLIIRRTNGNP